jgi:cellobiose-specific phosphotransferase system component IIC
VFFVVLVAAIGVVMVYKELVRAEVEIEMNAHVNEMVVNYATFYD